MYCSTVKTRVAGTESKHSESTKCFALMITIYPCCLNYESVFLNAKTTRHPFVCYCNNGLVLEYRNSVKIQRKTSHLQK